MRDPRARSVIDRNDRPSRLGARAPITSRLECLAPGLDTDLAAYGPAAVQGRPPSLEQFSVVGSARLNLVSSEREAFRLR